MREKMSWTLSSCSSLLASCCPGPHTDLQAEPCCSVCDVYKFCLLSNLLCCLHCMFRSCWLNFSPYCWVRKKKANSASLSVRHSASKWFGCSQHLSSILCLPKSSSFAISSRKGLESTNIYQVDFWENERRIISQVINILSTWKEESLVCFLPDLKPNIILKVLHSIYMLVKSINEHSVLHFILFYLTEVCPKFVRNVAFSHQEHQNQKV